MALSLGRRRDEVELERQHWPRDEAVDQCAANDERDEEISPSSQFTTEVQHHNLHRFFRIANTQMHVRITAKLISFRTADSFHRQVLAEHFGIDLLHALTVLTSEDEVDSYPSDGMERTRALWALECLHRDFWHSTLLSKNYFTIWNSSV